MQAPPDAPPTVIVTIPVPAGPAGLRTGDAVTVREAPDVTFRRC
jgi:hypothetical protein